MRFDELVLKIPGDELRVKFHPRMTILSGLGAPERQALAESVMSALTGGGDATALRLVDGTGRTVNLLRGAGGAVLAHHDDDGSPAAAPVGDLAGSPEALRALMLIQAADLGVVARPVRADEPRELREARASLEEITAQLQEALGEEQRTSALREELASLDEQLRAAHDGAARREYAQVLAQLERVRAEAATLQAGSTGVDADRHLLAQAAGLRTLADRWTAAAEELHAALTRFGGADRLAADELHDAAALPEAPPAGLDAHLDALRSAVAHRDTLDQRLQVLAVAKLPAPSDVLVGELGLLDQQQLWPAADRLVEAADEVHRVQVSLGGLGGDDSDAPVVIEEMELAHRGLEEAEQAAEDVRVPGVAGTGVGVALALAGAIGAPLLIPVGLLVAGAVGTATLLLPRRRIAKAAAVERAALDRADAPSYLGFHLRRVDATVDPNVRSTVEAAALEHRTALGQWVELVGMGVDVRRAKELEDEVQAYHDALRNLGGAADEIEQLRRDLADQAEPAVAAARDALAAACLPYGLAAEDLDPLDAVPTRVDAAIRRGSLARRQIELEAVEAREQAAAAELDAQLRQLGFDSGELDARLGALDWAVARSSEREEARANARPPEEIDAELQRLQEAARRLRRPEWSTVTAAEAASPDIEELQERRDKLAVRLGEESPEIDVVRLADRQAAVERRVMALEARHGGHDANGDPGAVADIQQHLLGRLTKAATAGAQGDPVPALLDEVFLRVPAERKWDLLDLLYRLSERHQLIYLSDDPFVAAWARQCKDGAVTLLEPETESV